MQSAEQGEYECDKTAANALFGATRGWGTMAIKLHALIVLGVRVNKQRGSDCMQQPLYEYFTDTGMLIEYAPSMSSPISYGCLRGLDPTIGYSH